MLKKKFFYYFKLPSLQPTSWNFFIKIYSIIYFSICHYRHYLLLSKIYISTFFSNFFFILNYPHYHRQVETFLSTFIQLFIFQFPTTLTTTDKLKLFYQHLFKNLFSIPHYPEFYHLYTNQYTSLCLKFKLLLL